MVPTLDKEELQKRMVQVANPVLADKTLRKNMGETSASRRFKMRMGKAMKSKIQPKTGLENKLDA